MRRKKKLFEVEYKDIFSPETIQSLKGQSAKSLKQYLGNKNFMQGMMKSMEMVQRVAELESGYEDELEMIAIEMVKDAYPVIDYANIEIDAKITSNVQLPDQGQEDDEDQDDDIPIDQASVPDNIKRRIINGITQGASIRGSFGFLLFREYLDRINPKLVEEYNELLKNAYGIYDDDNAIALMLSMISQNSQVTGGVSEAEYNEEEDKFVITARAINFPVLVQEIVKGLYEILSLQGFSADKEKNVKIVKVVDKYAHEPEDIRYGKFIYDAINKVYVDSGIDDPRVREFFFTELYKLSDEEFMSFVENAINNKLSPSQKKWAIDSMKDISRDLTKDDTGLEDLD